MEILEEKENKENKKAKTKTEKLFADWLAGGKPRQGR